jgi:hypothetical protein
MNLDPMLRPRDEEFVYDPTYGIYVGEVQEFLDALAKAVDHNGLRVNIQVDHLTPLIPEIVHLILKRRAEKPNA